MRYCPVLALGLAVTALLMGCEEAVDPVVGTDKAFSLYGVLQPRADTQWVRVYPIKDQLAPASPESLAATVTTTTVESGRTVSWRDSLIQEDDGRYAHVFWRPFDVDYGQTYRLQAASEEGETTHAEVTVPSNAALVLQEPQVNTSPVTVPVLVNVSVPRLINLEVEYYFQYERRENVGPNERIEAHVTLSYTGAQRRSEEGWIIPIHLSKDFEILRDRLRDAELWNPDVGLVMRNVTLSLAVVNEEWNPPGGEFDPDVLVEPGVMSNIEKGFGFLGAGYRLTKQWTPSSEVLKEAGWTLPSELH